MDSIFLFPRMDDGASLLNGLDIHMIPYAEANNSIDFVVNEGEEVTIQDQVFTPSGDIVVERGARLILRNAEVLFTHTGCFEHGIVLKENTTLMVLHSEIRGVSQISFVHSYLWALHCFNESTIDVLNAHLCYLFLRGRSSALIDDSQMIEVLLYDSSKASISDTTMKNVFYFDEGSATLSNCSYVDTIRFMPKLCDLTIMVLDEDTRDPIPMVNVTLDRPRGYEVASSLTKDDGAASFSGLEEGDYFAEVEMEGYAPLSVRIPLLNETQHETVMIQRMEGERSQIPANRYFSILIVIVFAVLVLSLFYGFHMRR